MSKRSRAFQDHPANGSKARGVIAHPEHVMLHEMAHTLDWKNGMGEHNHRPQNLWLMICARQMVLYY